MLQSAQEELWGGDTVCKIAMKKEPLCAGASEHLKGAPGEAVSEAALEAVNMMLATYRRKASKAGQPVQMLLRFQVMSVVG